MLQLIEIIKNEDTGKAALRCRFAAGERIIPKGNDEDIIRTDVAGPESLGKIAIDINGGLKGQRLPNGNAWKVIRLIRKNQDLGTVWDVRQAVHFQDAEKGEQPPAKKVKKTSVVAQDEYDDEENGIGKSNGRAKKAKKGAVDGDDDDDGAYAEPKSNDRAKRSRR